jgi:hypothetical protein
MRAKPVEPDMKKDETLSIVPEPAGGVQMALEIQNTRLADVLRRTELRLAIEASTARILSIALTGGTRDSDPEAA